MTMENTVATAPQPKWEQDGFDSPGAWALAMMACGAPVRKPKKPSPVFESSDKRPSRADHI